MGSEDHTVYVVDDDVRMCEALRELFTSLGVTSVTFGSVAEYIAYQKPDLPACLILDVELPDISGLDFQQQLGDREASGKGRRVERCKAPRIARHHVGALA